MTSSQALATEPSTLAGFLRETGSRWDEGDVVAAMSSLLADAGVSRAGTVGLSAESAAVWDAHSGLPLARGRAARAAAERTSLRSVAAASALAASALTAAEVADGLGLDASTVRHYRVQRRLHSFVVAGKARFPAWQFDDERRAPLPGLATVLAAVDGGLHPLTIAGFFTTEQPELELDGRPVTPREWLLGHGDPERVVALARDLGRGL